MTRRILVVDDNSCITQPINAEMLSNKHKPSVAISNCDDDCYKKFEKTNKRKNFTKPRI